MAQPGCSGTQPQGLTAVPGFFGDAGKSPQFFQVGIYPRRAESGNLLHPRVFISTHTDRDPTTQRAWLEPSHSGWHGKRIFRDLWFSKGRKCLPSASATCDSKVPPVPSLNHGQGQGISGKSVSSSSDSMHGWGVGGRVFHGFLLPTPIPAFCHPQFAGLSLPPGMSSQKKERSFPSSRRKTEILGSATCIPSSPEPLARPKRGGMSLEMFSGTNLAPAGALADGIRREASKAASQPGFILILPTFPKSRLCWSQPCPITTFSWMAAPLQSPFPCSRLENRDIFGGGSWAGGRAGAGSRNKGKTQQKKLERYHKRRENLKKSLSCPDTVYKRFGHCTQQRTDSFSPPFSSGKGSAGKAPSWRNPGSRERCSLQQESGSRSWSLQAKRNDAPLPKG